MYLTPTSRKTRCGPRTPSPRSLSCSDFPDEKYKSGDTINKRSWIAKHSNGSLNGQTDSHDNIEDKQLEFGLA